MISGDYVVQQRLYVLRAAKNMSINIVKMFFCVCVYVFQAWTKDITQKKIIVHELSFIMQ